jgi:hypothetical protein
MSSKVIILGRDARPRELVEDANHEPAEERRRVNLGRRCYSTCARRHHRQQSTSWEVTSTSTLVIPRTWPKFKRVSSQFTYLQRPLSLRCVSPIRARGTIYLGIDYSPLGVNAIGSYEIAG